MKHSKNNPLMSRRKYYASLFKTSSPSLRKLYWLFIILNDLLGFFLLYIMLSWGYSYLGLYLNNSFIRYFSVFLFFFFLSLSGFFFHIYITLNLLSPLSSFFLFKKGRGL